MDTENYILSHPRLRDRVAKKAKEKRGITTLAPYDPDHIPGKLQPKLVREPGKSPRLTYSPDNPDYIQALYRQIGITGSLAKSLRHPNTHGAIRGQSTSDALCDLLTQANQLSQQGSQPHLLILDIRNCFPTIDTTPAQAIIQNNAPSTAEYICHVHRQFREQTGSTRGTPQGHPIAADIVNITLDYILKPVRHRATAADTIIVSYLDDIAVLGPTTEAVLMAAHAIHNAIDQWGMALHPDKIRYAGPWAPHIDYLGYRIYRWSDVENRLGSPNPTRAPQLACKLTAAIDNQTRHQTIHGFTNAYPMAHPATTELMIQTALAIYERTPART